MSILFTDQPTYWYAIMSDPQDDWGTGTYDYYTACQMLIRQGGGLIAVIQEGPNPVCVQEIYYDDTDALLIGPEV